MKRAMRTLAVLGLATTMMVGATLIPINAEQDQAQLASSAFVMEALVSPAEGSDVKSFIAELEERVEQDPKDARSLALLGIAYVKREIQTHNPKYQIKAEAVIDRSLELQPDGNYEGFIAAGNLALVRHRFELAYRWGTKAADVRPYAAEPLGIMGDASIESGRYGRAARVFQRMVETRPALPSYARVSYFREMTGDLRGAIRAMRAAATAAGSSEDQGWTAIHLADLFIKKGWIKRAKSQLLNAKALTPRAHAVYYGLARVALIQGRPQAAIRIMKRLVTWRPLPAYTAFLGDLLLTTGHWSEAHRFFEMTESQIEQIRSGGEQLEADTFIFFLDHGSDARDVIADVKALYSRRPSVKAAGAYAWALLKMGKTHRAALLMREATRFGTQDPLIEYHAAVIFSKLGRPARARVELRKAISHGLAAWPLQMADATSL